MAGPAVAPVLALALLLTGGCGLLGPTPVVVGTDPTLAEAMAALEAAFEADTPDADVVVELAGGPVLAAQAREGAPLDLLAAGPATIAGLVADGRGLGAPIRLASTRLVIAVPVGNPDGVEGLEDLLGLAVVVGVPASSVGAQARAALEAEDVPLRPVSQEPDSRAVVARVAGGDADAGIAWAADVAAVTAASDGGASGRVEAILLPARLQPDDAALEVLLLTRRGEPFLEFLAGVEAQEILRRAGFGGP